MSGVRDFFSDPVRKFGLVDVVFALLYLGVFFFLIPPHTIPADVFAWGLPVVLLVAGLYMLTGHRWARRVALWVAAGFIAFTVFLVAALLWTAGYLQGVYGQLGKGFSLITLLAAVLVVELVGIWPIFQFRAMRRDAGGQGEAGESETNDTVEDDTRASVSGGEKSEEV